MPADLRFFHSFPRRRGRSEFEKAARILESILDSGLLLVPEINEFEGERDHDTGEVSAPVLAVQQRFCLTCIGEQELAGHAQLFGNFHLCFDPEALRRLGAVPVVYLPQAAADSTGGFDSVGTAIIHRLVETQGLLANLSALERVAHDGESMISIEHPDDRGERTFSADDVRWLLTALTSRRQGADVLASAVRTMAGLFQPVERSIADPSQRERLSYYRQREWRLLGGIRIGETLCDRPLTSGEKETLLSIDSEFFGRSRDFLDGPARVVDRCAYIPGDGGTPVHELIEKIIVPHNALESVVELLRTRPAWRDQLHRIVVMPDDSSGSR